MIACCLVSFREDCTRASHDLKPCVCVKMPTRTISIRATLSKKPCMRVCSKLSSWEAKITNAIDVEDLISCSIPSNHEGPIRLCVILAVADATDLPFSYSKTPTAPTRRKCACSPQAASTEDQMLSEVHSMQHGVDLLGPGYFHAELSCRLTTPVSFPQPPICHLRFSTVSHELPMSVQAPRRLGDLERKPSIYHCKFRQPNTSARILFSSPAIF